MTITLPDDIIAKLEALASHQNRTPADVLRDILADIPEPPVKQPKQRKPGLGKGTIWVSDDFDEYLGDNFWFPDDDIPYHDL